MPPKPDPREGWLRVNLEVLYRATLDGRLAWFHIEEPGRAKRCGVRTRNGREYEFKLRGGAWVRRQAAGGKV